MRRSPALLHLIIAATMVVTVGCGSDEGSDGAGTPEESTTTTEATTTTAEREGLAEGETCPATADLETVLGGPVESDNTAGASVAGSSDGTSLAYDYAGCEIQLTEGGQGEITVTRVTGAQVDGQPFDDSIYPTMREVADVEFATDGFEPLPEVSADAHRDGNQVVFLAGDVMVFVGVEVDGVESTRHAVELATALVASDKTIPSEDLDCRELGALVADSFGEVTEVSVSGGSTTIGDFAIERTGCGADHAKGPESSISVADAALWEDWISAMGSSTFTAHLTDLELAGLDAFDDGESLVIDAPGQPWIITAAGDDLEPDLAAVRLAVAELVVGT